MTKVRIACVLVALCACKKPAPVIHATPDTIAKDDAPPVEPDVCHPSVAWREGTFVVVGLPCVSRDGTEIVFAKTDERPKYPDLTIVAATRADKLGRVAVVMEPHEGAELLGPERKPNAELETRIARANVLLLDVAKKAVPLEAFVATKAGTHAGQGIEVAWTEKGRVTISREGRFMHQGDYNHWLEKLGSCSPPSYLAKVWGDGRRGVLLVKIAYHGSGGCTAMPELHVISWNP